MNYYRACHYNKLLKVYRQKGQVYYFPLRHSDGWSKWLSEVGEFHTFFEYVLYFVPFCTMQPFLPSVPFFAGEKMEERGNREARRKMSPASIWVLFHSSNSSLPATCLCCVPFLLKLHWNESTDPPSHQLLCFCLWNAKVDIKHGKKSHFLQ